MLFKSVKYLLFQIRRRRQKMNSGFFGFLSFIFSLLLSFVQGRLCFCFHPLTHWTEGCFWLRSSSTGTSACCRSALLEGTEVRTEHSSMSLSRETFSLWTVTTSSALHPAETNLTAFLFSCLRAGTFRVWTFGFFSEFFRWISWDNRLLVCVSAASVTLVSKISVFRCDGRWAVQF